MTFYGSSVGVRMFSDLSMRWFDKSDIAGAEALEKQEIAKFAVVDAERERVRLLRLGIREVARTYSVTLAEPNPTRKHGRRNLQ